MRLPPESSLSRYLLSGCRFDLYLRRSRCRFCRFGRGSLCFCLPLDLQGATNVHELLVLFFQTERSFAENVDQILRDKDFFFEKTVGQRLNLSSCSRRSFLTKLY